MARTPSERELRTLRAVAALETVGWTRLSKFDARPCLEAGWLQEHPDGYRLTPAGRNALNGDAPGGLARDPAMTARDPAMTKPAAGDVR